MRLVALLISSMALAFAAAPLGAKGPAAPQAATAPPAPMAAAKGAENSADPDRTPYLAVLLYESATEAGDRAFTEAARAGAEKAKAELGIPYGEVRLSPGQTGGETAREATLHKVATSGATHIVAVGFQNVVPVLKLAEAHPNVQFTVIDGIVPPLFSNVQSVLFKDHEGAFLVGMIAAYTSRTGIIGFIGGMDVPLIRNFAYGYMQGAQYARKEINVLSATVGSGRDAWSNPAKAAALAEQQFEEGADVIFAAAGGSGLGVLSAAEKNGKLAIGVDTNQNGLYPGHVLTSMVKRVDLAVFNALRQGRDGTWQPGIKYLGIKENMLDFAVDRHNKNLISRATIEKVEAAKEMILRGMIDIQVYSPN